MAAGKDLIDGLLDEFGVEASEFKVSDDVIDVVLQKYIRIWQDNLAKKNHIATGNLFQSIASDKGKFGFKTEVKGGVVRIYLSLPEYYEYTDIGRKPTEKSGTGIVIKKMMGLKGWISQKGIKIPTEYTIKRKLKDGTEKTKTYKYISNKFGSAKEKGNKALAFLISRKIHTKGFKGTNWFSSEVDNFKNDIINELQLQTGQIFKLVINKIVEDTNKK